MSPKNYPRQVHFSPTWNPTSTGTTAATGTGTGTTHPATSSPPAAQTQTTPPAAAVTTPVTTPPTQASTPVTSPPPAVVTTPPPVATIAEAPATTVPKANTTPAMVTFGTKAGTISSTAPSTTPSIAADSDGSNGTQIAIIGGSVVVAVVILACAAVAWLRRRNAKRRREEEGAEFNRHAAMRQSTLIPDDASGAALAPSTSRSQPMIDRHYNTPAVTYGYDVQPSYQGGPPQPAYQPQYAPGQVLFNAPQSGYATPSGYASGYATPGGTPATTLPSTQYAERAYSLPTGQPGSPMDQYPHDQYPVAEHHEPTRRTSAGAYSNMSRGEHATDFQQQQGHAEHSTEFQQQQYEDIERSLHGHDDPHGPAPASPSPFGDQAQAPPSPRPGMTQQVPPPVHPASAAAYPAAAVDHNQAARAPHGAAPAQRPMSTYDDNDAYGGM